MLIVWKTLKTIPLHNTDFKNQDENEGYIIHSIILLKTQTKLKHGQSK